MQFPGIRSGRDACDASRLVATEGGPLGLRRPLWCPLCAIASSVLHGAGASQQESEGDNEAIVPDVGHSDFKRARRSRAEAVIDGVKIREPPLMGAADCLHIERSARWRPASASSEGVFLRS